MFKAYDLKLSDWQIRKFTEKYGSQRDDKKLVQKMHDCLIDYANNGWTTPDFENGDELRDNWFPYIEADIFMSHSHDDLNIARCIKNGIETELGLNVFLDEDVWSYCDELLKQIDKVYCYDEKRDAYSYKRRNYTTAVVHNLLSIALTKMIDKTECVFFLNTNNSNLSSEYESNVTTGSVWINYELWMVDVLERKKTRKSVVFDSLTEGRQLEKMKFNPPTKRLKELTFSTFEHWLSNGRSVGVHPLDCLYKYTE